MSPMQDRRVTPAWSARFDSWNGALSSTGGPLWHRAVWWLAGRIDAFGWRIEAWRQR